MRGGGGNSLLITLTTKAAGKESNSPDSQPPASPYRTPRRQNDAHEGTTTVLGHGAPLYDRKLREEGIGKCFW